MKRKINIKEGEEGKEEHQGKEVKIKININNNPIKKINGDG
jgi:hypothetical protein